MLCLSLNILDLITVDFYPYTKISVPLSIWSPLYIFKGIMYMYVVGDLSSLGFLCWLSEYFILEISKYLSIK